MSAKIVNSSRYKKITKTQLERKKRNNEKAIKLEKKNSNKKTNKYSSEKNNNLSFISNLTLRKHTQKKKDQDLLLYARPKRTVIKEPKQKIYIPKSFIISCSVLVLVILAVISVKVTNLDDKITQTVFNNSDGGTSATVKLEEDYELKVALLSLDTTDVYSSINLILNDLYKNTSYSLVKIENDYEIVNFCASNIEKVSNAEYNITLNTKYNIDIDDINYSIEKILDAGSSNLYYERVDNILSVESIDENEIKITLKEDDPYFIYKLDFPVTKEIQDEQSYIYSYTQEDSSVVFKRSAKSDNTTLSSVTLISYSSINDIVTAFTSGQIDMFFATSNNEMQLIGQTDYNVKKYKDGETLFIFGNKNSDIFSRKEIRTALMYSLNRDEIVKSSDNNFIELIDLPFLYSSIKYKYDLVGAQNIMNANGWYKNSAGIYDKSEDGVYVNATLTLLVNSGDTDKLDVASSIKTMAYEAGINIEIEALSSDEISQRVATGDYDIVLATVYLNETPDITFLRDYVDINENTTEAFLQVENSSSQDLSSNIQNLEYVLSDEVACIGIYARNINLVYQKDIYYGFENINYMNIFYDLDSIGKLVE